jgi:hypothetical protein
MENLKKLKNRIFLIVPLIFLFACLQMSPIENLYYKQIKIKNYHIEWFFHSTLSNTSPDFHTIRNGVLQDTIFEANNLFGVSVSDSDKLVLKFAGEPSGINNIKFIEKKYNLDILLDTSLSNSNIERPKWYKTADKETY